MYTQLITPTPDIACRPGWCLEYVRSTYSLPARYDNATQAWENSTAPHPDWEFPEGVAVPVWFSIDGIPAGHVALRMPDGSVYSSSDYGSIPHHHPTIADLIDYYERLGRLTLTFLGWSEDVAGYAVIAPSITAQGATTTEQEIDVALTEDQDATIHSANIRADVARQEATNAKVLAQMCLEAIRALSTQIATGGNADGVSAIVDEMGKRLSAAAAGDGK